MKHIIKLSKYAVPFWKQKVPEHMFITQCSAHWHQYGRGSYSYNL